MRKVHLDVAKGPILVQGSVALTESLKRQHELLRCFADACLSHCVAQCWSCCCCRSLQQRCLAVRSPLSLGQQTHQGQLGHCMICFLNSRSPAKTPSLEVVDSRRGASATPKRERDNQVVRCLKYLCCRLCSGASALFPGAQSEQALWQLPIRTEYQLVYDMLISVLRF